MPLNKPANMKYLVKYRTLLVIAALLVIFSSCSTFLFEPVSKKIVGTWVADPVVSPTPDTWTFNSNGTCTLSFHATTDSNVFFEPGTKHVGADTTLSNIPYSVTSSLGRYYLNIDGYANLMGYASNQFRFIVIRVNATEMYLESQILFNPAQVGYIQISFSKQQQ